MDKRKVSKTLSYVLRHKPEQIGIIIDKNGWTDVNDLLNKISIKVENVTFEVLEEVVAENDKQRFSFNEDKTKIRANQGHSIKVDLELKTKRPPKTLYHGTTKEAIDGIVKSGLIKMNRQHVHLSDEKETATKVGSRRGKAIIIFIDTQKMYADGFKFYQSENGVWLTDHVPSKYLYI
jgi:putative RNA 2'-phosphotransferase